MSIESIKNGRMQEACDRYKHAKKENRRQRRGRAKLEKKIVKKIYDMKRISRGYKNKVHYEPLEEQYDEDTKEL